MLSWKQGVQSAALGCYSRGARNQNQGRVSVVHTELRREAPACIRDPPRILGSEYSAFLHKGPFSTVREGPGLLTTPALPASPASPTEAGLVAGLSSVTAGGNVPCLLSSLSPASLCFLFASEEDILGTGFQHQGWLWRNRRSGKSQSQIPVIKRKGRRN